MKKRIGVCLLCTVCFLLAAACGKRDEDTAGQTVDVYYMNKDETHIQKEEYELQSTDTAGQIQELLEVMAMPPESNEIKAVITSGFTILGAAQDGEQLVINLDERYKELDPSVEILTRAALVRTLTQIPGITYVSMQVREEPLTDQSGNPVGVMEAAMFIDNAGDEINSYERVKLKLYFADETGTELREITRTVVYNSNISMEKLVVEQLIAGPNSKEVYPTINPETKVNNVTVKDGTCYVNLNENFLTQTYNVSSEVTIYSIVNSLVELANVNKVQISINGETDGTYREAIPFSTVFERNLEVIS